MDYLHTSTYVRQQLELVVREHLGRWLSESFEGLTTEVYERIYQIFSDAKAVEFVLDDYLSRSLSADVPDFVKRVMRLEPVPVPRLPEGPANVYLREAARCYFHGLNQGAVTLARAAVEQGLRECVPFAAQNRWTLDELIDAAGRFKSLSNVHMQMATDVQRLGNTVLHSQPCSSEQACQALTKARGVLETLFASE